MFGKAIRDLGLIGAIALATALGAPTLGHAQNQPSVTLQSVLDMDVYESGFMGFDYTDVAFAPAGTAAASIRVLGGSGQQIAEFGYFPNYKVTAAVFGRLQPENHSEFTFQTGDYALEFVVNGTAATRVPFSVVAKSTSDDPFNPGSTVRFVGPWQKWAYFTFEESNDVLPASVTFWAGASDMPPGQIRGPILTKLKRNGEVVAHSKISTGMLDHEWLRAHKTLLFHPHDQKTEPNAKYFGKSDLSQTGDYVLTVEMKETGEVIRSFAFQAANNQLVPNPRTVLGYQPHTDYIPSRVIQRGASSYAFQEAFWIAAPSE